MGQQQPDENGDIGAKDALELLRRSLSSSSPSSPRPTPIPFLCLDVAEKTGLLAEVLQWKNEDLVLENDGELRNKVQTSAGALLMSLLTLSEECGIDLGAAAVAKIDLNGRKYPATLVKGKAHKYDHYSAQTGIKKEGQSIGSVFQSPPWDGAVSLNGLQVTLREFVAERDWGKYHAPRNLLLALVGEMGELCEIVKTLRGGPAAWPRASKDELAQEVADVFIYLLRFSDVCKVDLRQGLREAVAAEAARQKASRKQGWGGGEKKEGQKKEKGFASSTYLLSGVAAACVGAVLFQKR